MMLRELEIARDVQARLVPQQPPRLEGLECASFFRPAKFVGGDYFDFIETPDGGLAFTLGDVSGKGIPAALLMANIQAALRIALRRGLGSLTELFRDLNKAIYATSSTTMYSTLFCGLIDARRRSLHYVNAGHCPPMLVRHGEARVAIERLTTGGTPIGLLPAAEFSEAAVALNRGDLLLCYSDGISEATNPQDEMWHESEIESILLSEVNQGAQEMTNTLDDFTGTAEQADDMTVVALRVR
jgi:sigma-B regulation protein RsbU (phosphoserine phosphatase)